MRRSPITLIVLLLALVALVALMAVAGVAGAQTRDPAGDGTESRVELPPSVVPANVTEVRYGEYVYELADAEGTLGLCFVLERIETEAGASVTCAAFVHDAAGWRSAGILTGDAIGAHAGAEPGDTLTFALLGGPNE